MIRSLPRALLVSLLLVPAVRADDPPAKLGRITEAMQRFVDGGGVAGVVTCVGRADGVLHHDAVGYRDLDAKDAMKKDSLFRIASMTKPITAVAIMILADAGKLSPEDDVAKHLPEFTGQMLVASNGKDAVTLKKPARPVKLRDLLTHTGGIAPYPPGVDDVYTKRNRTLAETTLAAALRPLQFEPGSKWAYSNSGIDTLGRVIEVVSGESYEAFLKAHIFDPLGMTDTTFDPTPEQRKRLAVTYGSKDGHLVADPNSLIGLKEHPKHPIPAGGLVSSAADLAKVYRMMLHKGELDGKRILSETAVAEMTRTQTGEIKTGFVPGMSFGYGWAVVKEPQAVTEMLSAGTYGHGGAFGTQAWIDPHKGLFMVPLIQRTGLENADGSEFRKALQRIAVEDAKPPVSYPVVLRPGEPDSKLAPRYSPHGRQLNLEPKVHKELPGSDHLEARMTLGPNTAGAGYLLVLARSKAGKPYDLLFVDRDGTGKVGATPVTVPPKEVRKKLWSSFDAAVRVNHAKPGAPAAYEDFPVAFWVVVEKDDEVPDVLRVSRRGFLAGEVKLGDTAFDVILSDSGNDGVYGPGDWWEIRSKDPKGDGMRTVGDFAWAGGKAWKLELDGTNGRKGRIVSFDPGLTEAEDLEKRDLMREDRLAKRADKPVAFRKDVDAALKDAAQKKGPYFLKFETDWCGSCKEMTALVFSAKDVADAAAGVTCVVVDGDDRKDLTDKHQVKSYPTGILFDADGKEVARYTGYQSVKRITAFLQEVKK